MTDAHVYIMEFSSKENTERPLNLQITKGSYYIIDYL